MNRSDRPVAAVLGIIVLGLMTLFIGTLAYLTAYGYLLPVAHRADVLTQPTAAIKTRHAIGAYSGLLLTLVLLDLAIMSLMTYRIIRFLRPRRAPTRVKTVVVDAWAEAGKRAAEANDE